VQLLCDYVKTATRDGKPLKDDPVLRQRVAQFATELEVARLLGIKFVDAALSGKTPTYEASAYKLYATELSLRVANATMDIVGPGAQLALGTEEAPLNGRGESCYTYTVIDTIGGGSSEVQRNIISKRKLGLPKNF
jgi:alkylation response protein AidB-like acyl-CoA dehydrogenase